MSAKFAPRKPVVGYRSKLKKEPEAKASSGRGAWIGSGLTLIGILVPASIAIATWKINDANFRAGMLNNFYARGQSEEAFWKGLYDDYLTTFANELEGHDDWRRARLVAIMDFQRSREIPTFQEFVFYGVRRELIDAERDRLNGIRRSLCEGLRDRASSDPLLQSQFDRRTFECGQRAHAAPSAPAPSAHPLPSSLPAPHLSAAVASQVPLNNNLRAPDSNAIDPKSRPSNTGWDLDIFWCRGPAQNLNYRRATMLGEEFGRLATDGRAIAPGVRLGQVRLRPVSVGYQENPNSPARSSWVVADAGPGEAEAAAAVQSSANTLLGQTLIGAATSGGTPTRWYLSLFVCGASEQT